MLNTGAILFDDEKTPSMGWACRFGESPFRVPGVHVLPSDTFWLTNVSYDDMNASGILDHAVFRHNNYLRLPVGSILLELGFTDNDGKVSTPDQAVAAIASIFERMIRLSAWIGGLSREEWKPPMRNLRLFYRQTLFPADQRLDPALQDAIDEATQAFSRTRMTAPFDCQRFTLVVPRLAHARRILDTPIPAGPECQVVSPPEPGTSVTDWVRQVGGPMLIKASVGGMSSMVSQVINFGGATVPTARRDGRDALYQGASTRQWITSEEACVLDRLGELTIEKAIVFTRWTTVLHAIEPIKEFFGMVEPLDHLSYTVGLFAENLWTGLTLTNESSPADRGLSANLAAPFLRSMDRLNCLEHVMDVVEQEYSVTGFGVGRVMCATRNGREDPILAGFRVAGTAGLVAPFPPPEVGAVETPPMISDDPAYRAMIELRASGKREQFLDVDREVVEGFVHSKAENAPVAT